ncbi:2-C-methyl-D-erythritol 4-phosphate cytidylyltransferase [Bacillus sp. SH5-2]|nr:2-C-methyl-D-erythritol 4-phosphate cytidylyltransferase [Bacillus sp. SH5-2]QDQ08857.1 2-C-methyl-D-erythritol 4-phosphate cytidylyltransferase [Bacillus sp. BD59S]
MPTRSPPYTAVFTHHFTCVNCISKILSCKKFSFIIPKK